MTSPESQPNQESPIQIQVEDLGVGKGVMISFKGKTEDECIAYNNAIKDVLKREKIKPIHKFGKSHSGNNNPGLHVWEISQDIDERTLGLIISDIEDVAKLYL